MAPHRPTGEKQSFTTFGWQGINLTVLSEWTLVSTRGDRRAGYVRLDDERRARLELRWEKTDRLTPPSRGVDRYLDKLQKSARKEGTDLSVQRNLRLARPPGKDVECYRWVGEQQAVAMLSRCEDCNRTLHIHLLGEPDEQLKSLARTVFSSVQDHPDDGVELWRFFDVEFESPVHLPLKRQSLKVGCIRMCFATRAARLEFVRVSLAEVLLADRALEEWFREFYAKFLKWRTYSLEADQVKGHPGLRVEGRVPLVLNPLRVLGRDRQMRAACWHCEQTNRLMICSFEGLQREAGVFQDALASSVCCRGA
ncbi:MAG: hypothetical protein PVJ27_01330 [Candidatus Brocadiaceae bacterium]|jgi:hypothetical protein